MGVVSADFWETEKIRIPIIPIPRSRTTMSGTWTFSFPDFDEDVRGEVDICCVHLRTGKTRR
jgi:hypothetical protein